VIGLRVPKEWAPPQDVAVTLLYADGKVERLWVCEAFRRPAGTPEDWRWFLACGPAGKLVPPISRSFVSGLPEGGRVVLLTERDWLDRLVFRAPKHTLN
jgi:hypothetical protein